MKKEVKELLPWHSLCFYRARIALFLVYIVMLVDEHIRTAGAALPLILFSVLALFDVVTLSTWKHRVRFRKPLLADDTVGSKDQQTRLAWSALLFYVGFVFTVWTLFVSSFTLREEQRTVFFLWSVLINVSGLFLMGWTREVWQLWAQYRNPNGITQTSQTPALLPVTTPTPSRYVIASPQNQIVGAKNGGTP